MLLLKNFGLRRIDLVFSKAFELNIVDIPLPIAWVPATICNPGVMLHFVDSKPLLRVLIEQSLHEVYQRVFIPAIKLHHRLGVLWCLILNALNRFLSVLAHEWSLFVNHFVQGNRACPKISLFVTVILHLERLGAHVGIWTSSLFGFRALWLFLYFAYSEIGEFDIVSWINENVLRLDIAMIDVRHFMAVPNGRDELPEIFPYLCLGQTSFVNLLL